MNYLRRQQIRFQQWRERQRKKCKVRIRNPEMCIKGKICPNCTDDNENFIAFFGIPYAEPPVGSLRFQPPQPYRAPRPNYIHKAYDREHPCLQYEYDSEPYGKEDCLYLNIYLPRKPKYIRTPLPVLVLIHGGAFDHGSGDISNIKPDNIIKQNMIFVTINYRLGVFGFLNMGTNECKGNAGLKDQVLALKWIKDNIKRFGGDSKNITISGHSAGATCVNLHMISPMSKGLFHKAIVQAGGMYCPWGFLGNQQKVGQLFTKVMQTEAMEFIVESLKSQDPHELLNVMQNINNELIALEPKKLVLFMGPTLERERKDAFLPFGVEYLRRQADPVPLMAGICEGEGFLYILDKLQYYPNGIISLIIDDREFITFLKQNFRWSEETAVKHKDTIRKLYFPPIKAERREDFVKKTLKDYFETEIMLDDFTKALADLNTDIWFRRFYDNFNIGNTPQPFYVYKFSYIADNDRLKSVGDGSFLRVTAPIHGDENSYQYEPERFQFLDGGQISPEKQTVINTMCSLLAKFCRTGDFRSSILHRSAEWRPHTVSNPCFLNIDQRLTMRQGRLNENRWRALNEIVEAEPTVETPPVSVRMVISQSSSGEWFRELEIFTDTL